MNFKEFIRLTYGLFMGTSTPYLKPNNRYLFPTHRLEVDGELSLFLGGSAVCGLLSKGNEALVINTNQARPAELFRAWVSEKAISQLTVVLSSVDSDFSGGLRQFAEASKIFVAEGGKNKLRHQSLAILESLGEQIEELVSEKVIEVAGERIRLIPVGASASGTDLAVYLETRSILFAGALFYNRIHPILRPDLDVALWINKFDSLLKRLNPTKIVPAEGDVASREEAEKFLDYLRDLTDTRLDFSTCRKLYDWPEIPSCTSLEENFDFLRLKFKSHVRVR